MSAITFTRDEFKNYCKSIDLLTGVNASCTALKAEFNHKNQEWKIQAKKDGQNKVCAKNRGCNFLATYSVTKDLLNIQLLASKYLIGPEIQEVWRCVNTNDAVVITSLLNGDDLATYIKSNLGNIQLITRLVISVYYMLQTLHKLGYVLGNADQLDKIIGNHKKITEKQFRVYITDFSKTRLDASPELRNNDYKMFYAAITKLTGGDEVAQHIVQYVHSHYLREKLDVPPPLESVKQEVKQEVVKQVQAQSVMKEQQVQQQPVLNAQQVQPDEFHDLPEPNQQELRDIQSIADFQKKNGSDNKIVVAPNMVSNTLNVAATVASSVISGVGNLLFGSSAPVVVKQEYPPPPGELNVIKDDDEQKSNSVMVQSEQKSDTEVVDFESVSHTLAEMKKQGVSIKDVVKAISHSYVNYGTIEAGEFSIFPIDGGQPDIVPFNEIDTHVQVPKYIINKNGDTQRKQIVSKMKMFLIEYMLYVYIKTGDENQFTAIMNYNTTMSNTNVYTYLITVEVDCLYGGLICDQKSVCNAAGKSAGGRDYRKCIGVDVKPKMNAYPRNTIDGLKNKNFIISQSFKDEADKYKQELLKENKMMGYE